MFPVQCAESVLLGKFFFRRGGKSLVLEPLDGEIESIVVIEDLYEGLGIGLFLVLFVENEEVRPVGGLLPVRFRKEPVYDDLARPLSRVVLLLLALFVGLEGLFPVGKEEFFVSGYAFFQFFIPFGQKRGLVQEGVDPLGEAGSVVALAQHRRGSAVAHVDTGVVQGVKKLLSVFFHDFPCFAVPDGVDLFRNFVEIRVDVPGIVSGKEISLPVGLPGVPQTVEVSSPEVVALVEVRGGGDHHAEPVHPQLPVVLQILHPGALMEKVMDFPRHFRMVFEGGSPHSLCRPGVEHRPEFGCVGRAGGIVQRVQITASVGADHHRGALVRGEMGGGKAEILIGEGFDMHVFVLFQDPGNEIVDQMPPAGRAFVGAFVVGIVQRETVFALAPVGVVVVGNDPVHLTVGGVFREPFQRVFDHQIPHRLVGGTGLALHGGAVFSFAEPEIFGMRFSQLLPRLFVVPFAGAHDGNKSAVPVAEDGVPLLHESRPVSPEHVFRAEKLQPVAHEPVIGFRRPAGAAVEPEFALGEGGIEYPAHFRNGKGGFLRDELPVFAGEEPQNVSMVRKETVSPVDQPPFLFGDDAHEILSRLDQKSVMTDLSDLSGKGGTLRKRFLPSQRKKDRVFAGNRLFPDLRRCARLLSDELGKLLCRVFSRLPRAGGKYDAGNAFPVFHKGRPPGGEGEKEEEKKRTHDQGGGRSGRHVFLSAEEPHKKRF